jgi:hypothetical protein
VSQINFRNLRASAQWTQRSSRFNLRRVDKTLRSPADRLEYVLRERTGLYLVVLQDEEGSSSHVVGIDCKRNPGAGPNQPESALQFFIAAIYDGFLEPLKRTSRWPTESPGMSVSRALGRRILLINKVSATHMTVAALF